MTGDDRSYCGHDGRYYCKRSHGATGQVAASGGGAALGKSLDRDKVRCR